ncbi:winged helix-turn-helix domain-containing protein [Aurantiacibacter zhengii]|uniref:Transcriptional regulator n=1 Tax=Aurantiacibacter zhengii TaxID=2307003 RepID=A0A418NR22_9SPHN|nr:transcriptional regulator [Aurantiacibacter zhengii]RIV85148.1 transcriptional regulator [Aurantiacibacter zhengii]
MATDPSILHFDCFALDRANRRLLRGDEEIDIGSRYFDALAMLVQARGDLVTKDRFMDEVWRGIPVTDEALTQCIRTLRRALGDDAASPRYIATVPKHGYRFVGELVDDRERRDTARPDPAAGGLSRGGRIAAAATIGGAGAGVIGGLLYGILLAGSASGGSGLVLTLLALCIAVGVLGGAGVGIGMGLASGPGVLRPVILVAGGGIGGLVVGAIGRLVGLDLFQVLAGVGIGPVTGILEGALVGMLAGGGCALARRFQGWRGGAAAAVLGGAGGMLVALSGGRLMAGSLALLDSTVAERRLGIDAMGAMLGEGQFGPLALLASSALEAAVFVSCVALAVRRA